MPHRVATFFRNSTNTLENQVINLKKSTIRSRTKSPNRTTSGGIANRESRSAERVVSTYASSIDEDMDEPTTPNEHPQPPPQQQQQQQRSRPTSTSPAPPAVRRPTDSPRLRPRDGHEKDKDKDKDHHHHRLSFPSFHLARSKDSHHTNPHATISWKIESPPIIFHGDAESSTGALVSGQLFLDVKDEAGYEVDSFKATLHIHVTQKKPFTVHCSDCTNHYTLLKEWVFLDKNLPPATGAPIHLSRGLHAFPFSVLLDGHLPATLDSPLVNIAYEFKAEAFPSSPSSAAGAVASSSHQHPIRLEKIFDVKRSLPVSELPHHSVRVFPPTNVKASVHYQQVIHPIGSNTLTMRLDGIAKNNTSGTTNTIEYWKLKKLTWRLEETLKTVAPACEKHDQPQPTTGTGEDQQPPKRNGVARTETRIIGEKTLFSGWKSSYAGPTDSSVDLELEYSLNKHARYSCDLKSRDGTEVSHQLMLEMVVSQECAPVGKPGLITQTGVGRILRMHFGTVLTERGGIGISWDNEAPPIYQDVPPSPPAYPEDAEKAAAAAGASFVESLPDIMESLDGRRPAPTNARPALAGPSGSGRSSERSSAEGHR